MSAREPLADRERPRGGALRATFRMLCCPFRAYRGCGSVVGDPMTRAHGLVALYAASITSVQRGSRSASSSKCHCASSRYRRLPLSVPLAMMLPWAAPARPHCSQGPPRAMPQGFPGLSLAAAPRYANKTTHCRRSSPPCTTQTNHILSTRGCFSRGIAAAPASRQRAACPPLLRAGVRQLSP